MASERTKASGRSFIFVRTTEYLSEIQDVLMKGIQNKIIIFQKAFIIHIYGLRYYKGKLTNFFLSI
jgi:hypothetical protein